MDIIKQLNRQLKDKLYSALKKQGNPTNYRIGKTINVSESFLSAVKSGKKNIPMTVMLKICHAFKLNFDFKPGSLFSCKKNQIILNYLSSNNLFLLAA